MIGRDVLLRAALAGMCALFTLGATTTAARAGDAGEAVASAPRFALAVERDTLYRMDAGYDLFTRKEGDDAPGLSLSYDLLRPGPRTTIAVSVGWNGEALSNRWGGGNRAELDVHTFQGAVAARYALLWWLEPQVRVAAGVSLAHAELGVDRDAMTLEGDARSVMGSAGAGLRLRTRSARFLALLMRASLAAEGGMAAGTPLALKLDPGSGRRGDSAAARDRIPTTAVDLGTLGRVHPYLRFTFALHF